MTRSPFPIVHQDADHDEAAIRAALAHDSDRLAAAAWWGRMGLLDARQELRGLAVLQDLAAGGLTYRSTCAQAIADELLDSAVAARGRAYEAILPDLQEAAIAALRAGAARPEVVAAAVEVARQRDPKPPPAVIFQAVEEAAAEFRFTERWWRRRAQAA